MFTLLSPARAQPGSPPNFHPPVLFDLQTCLTSGERPDRIALADVNGDLWPDIAVANEFSCQIEPGGTPVFTVSFFRNTGDWNPHSDALVLQQKIVLPCGLFPTEVAFARIDADTRLDLLVVTQAGDSFDSPGRLRRSRPATHYGRPPAGPREWPAVDPFIAHHLKGVSRTYAILIPMLPNGLADAVGLAYLLMRIVDTIEDATGISDAERLARFDALERILLDLPGFPEPAAAALGGSFGDTPAERELLAAGPGVFQRLAVLPAGYRDPAIACGCEMMRGIRDMLARSHARGLPYPGNRDAAELRTYCYYVAGVVGAMLCAMMAAHLRLPPLLRLRDVAVELGIGLQLVNILKDALKDAGQGRRYLPTIPSGEVSQAEVFRVVLDEARESLRRGSEFVLALPATARELRSFCGLPIAWGALTLARAERDASRAKIGRGVIRSTIARFSRLASDDRALRGWFGRLLRMRPRRSSLQVE